MWVLMFDWLMFNSAWAAVNPPHFTTMEKMRSKRKSMSVTFLSTGFLDRLENFQRAFGHEHKMPSRYCVRHPNLQQRLLPLRHPASQAIPRD
jgi:hypothetical protein